MHPIEWIKRNKLATFLIVFVAFLFLRSVSNNNNIRPKIVQRGAMMESQGVSGTGIGAVTGMADFVAPGAMSKSYQTSPYPQESVSLSPTARKVVEETSLSLQVKDVSQSVQDIKNKAQSLNGFMVNAYVSKPEEASSGNITIRVPSETSEEMLNFLRANAVKVVSENLSGSDVTDQYSDIDAKLAILIENKATMESFMRRAENIDEILRVQNQIFALQDQIDSLKGQKKYLEDVSSSMKMTVYLSTDEFSLPYSPDNNWRPEVVLKNAVRSLVITLRGLAERLIWITVFAVIWIPLVIVAYFVWKWYKKRKLEKEKNQTPSVKVTLSGPNSGISP